MNHLYKCLIILVLLTITVPWFAGKMSSSLLGLPLWFWYALMMNVVFSTAVCLLYDKWWSSELEEEPAASEMNAATGSGTSQKEEL